MRHGRAVVVRRGVLELVDVDGEDLALAVEHDVGKDLVDAVNGRTRVVGAGTHAHGVGESEALIGLSCGLRGLSRLGSGLRLGLGAGAGYGVLDGVDDAVAGVGRAGDDVHVRRVRRDDGRRYLLERRARYLGRLAVRHDLDRGDSVAVHGDGDGDGTHEAVGRAGERSAGAARALQRVLDGVDDTVAGVSRTGDDIDVGRVRRDDGRGYLLERRARYLGRLAVGDHLDCGDLVAVHGDGDSDGAAEAVGRAGEHAGRAGLLHVLARRIDAGDDGRGAYRGAGDGVDVAVHGEVALGVHEANEEVEVVLHSEAKAVGVVDVADGVALDHAVIVDGDEKLDLVHIAVRGHGQDVAALALVDVGDLRVGAIVFDLLELAAAGQQVGDHLVELSLSVGRRGAGQAGARRREYDRADQDYGNGDKQFLHALGHFPAPPFATPKRFTGTALSSAQAQAFMMRIA